jgi:hypothetical protein
VDRVGKAGNGCKNVTKQEFLTTKRIDSLSEYKVSTRPLLISPSPIQAPLSIPGNRHSRMPTLVAGSTGASRLGTGGSLSGHHSNADRPLPLTRFQSRGFYVPVGRAISTAMRARHASLRSREEHDVAPSL